MVLGRGARWLRRVSFLGGLVLLPLGHTLAQERAQDLEEQPSAGFVRPLLGVPGFQGIVGDFDLPRGLQTLHDQRWEGIVRQRLDAGCGPASLATLYSYYLGIPVTEEEMLRAVTAETLRRGRTARDIRRRGYSMRDIKRVAERGRLVAAAFRGKVEDLHELRIPVITQVAIRGYHHFVVLLGVAGDRVMIADPNFGNSTMPLGQFRGIWSGIMLAIGRPKRAALEPHWDATDFAAVREIDYASFTEGPQVRPPSFPRWLLQSQRVVIGGDFNFEAFDNFTPLSVERTTIRLNLD